MLRRLFFVQPAPFYSLLSRLPVQTTVKGPSRRYSRRKTASRWHIIWNPSSFRCAVEQLLGVSVRNPELYDHACRPRWMLHQGEADTNCYERLEWLGDAVLQAVVTQSLCRTFPQEDEVSLADRLRHMVSNAALAEFSRGIGWDKHIFGCASSSPRLSRRQQDTLLSDALEALVGAIHLDLGFPAATKFVQRVLFDQSHVAPHLNGDYKTVLRKLLGSHGIPAYRNHVPRYVIQSVHHERPSNRSVPLEPPAHTHGAEGPTAAADAPNSFHPLQLPRQTWKVELQLPNLTAVGVGPQRELAEQDAARQGLLALRKQMAVEQWDTHQQADSMVQILVVSENRHALRERQPYVLDELMQYLEERDIDVDSIRPKFVRTKVPAGSRATVAVQLRLHKTFLTIGHGNTGAEARKDATERTIKRLQADGLPMWLQKLHWHVPADSQPYAKLLVHLDKSGKSAKDLICTEFQPLSRDGLLDVETPTVHLAWLDTDNKATSDAPSSAPNDVISLAIPGLTRDLVVFCSPFTVHGQGPTLRDALQSAAGEALRLLERRGTTDCTASLHDSSDTEDVDLMC